jgi:hypothetical protein
MNISTTKTPILTLRSSLIFKNRPNLIEFSFVQMNVTNFGNEYVTLYLIKDGDLDHHTNFEFVDEDYSSIEKDTSCETINNGEIKYSLMIPPSKTKIINLDSLNTNICRCCLMSFVAESVSNTTNISLSVITLED